MKTSPPETILFAVVGMSPAVLTETAWALARMAQYPKRNTPGFALALAANWVEAKILNC